jgi:putative glutathione S-transferase
MHQREGRRQALDFQPSLTQIQTLAASASMAPPAPLVRTARSLWHWQWQQLMGGLGPADAEGNYRRPAGAFSVLPPLPNDAAAADGHVLIVGRSCPWAHRAWLVWSLRGLGASITLVVVDPDPAEGRWRFAEAFEGCQTLVELYQRSGADAGQRATVPALYSRRERRILVGESARLIELLNRWPSADAPNLEPAPQQAASEQWRDRLQSSVNDGVYRCGFARTQGAYDRAEAALFEAPIGPWRARPG